MLRSRQTSTVCHRTEVGRCGEPLCASEVDISGSSDGDGSGVTDVDSIVLSEFTDSGCYGLGFEWFLFACFVAVLFFAIAGEGFLDRFEKGS